MLTLLGLAAIIALVAANAFFVAAEFAYVAVRRGHLEEQADAGDAKASAALAVLRRLSFVLSGAQLGITVTSLVLGFIAAPLLTELLTPAVALSPLPTGAVVGIATATGFVLATALQMVIGELAPKNLAIARPAAFARALALPTRLYTTGAAPVIRFFDGSANWLLRRLGIEPVEELEGGVSAEELELIIVESTTGGQLTAEQAELLTRILEFRQLRAADVMVPRPQVVTVPANARGAALRALAGEHGHSRFPVIDDQLDEVLGIVQAKDLLKVAPAERDLLPVRALLSPVLAVPESSKLASVVGEMRRARSPMAVVIDEYGATVGVVTIEDVVEELFGSIQDEHDRLEPMAQAVPDGGWRVPGAWRVDEVERATGVSLPAGDWDTVGGLVMAHLGRVPEIGDRVAVPGADIVVDSMDGLAVGQVLVRETAPAGDEDER